MSGMPENRQARPFRKGTAESTPFDLPGAYGPPSSQFAQPVEPILDAENWGGGEDRGEGGWPRRALMEDGAPIKNLL